MKNTIVASLSTFVLLLAPAPVLAAFSVSQGGTGQSSFPVGACIMGNGTNPLTSTYSPSFEYITATSTTATSTFSGNVSINGRLEGAAGFEGQVQYNSGGSFQGVPGMVWDGLGTLIVPFRMEGGGALSNEDGGAGGAVVEMGAPTLTTSTEIRSGNLGIQGGDLGASDEAAFSNGLYAGAAFIGGGGVQTDNGFASPGTIEMIGGKWENGIGWTGGDLRISAGSAGLLLGSGTTINGKISLVNHLDIDAILDVSSLLGGDKTYTFPNRSGTFGLLEADQVWSGANTFNQGPTATTTFTIGQIGSTTSRSCFNTKNTTGDDISFYFVGTSMVVESNTCR